MLGLCRWSELRHAGVAAMPLCHDSYSAGILAAKWGSKPGTAAKQDRTGTSLAQLLSPYGPASSTPSCRDLLGPFSMIPKPMGLGWERGGPPGKSTDLLWAIVSVFETSERTNKYLKAFNRSQFLTQGCLNTAVCPRLDLVVRDPQPLALWGDFEGIRGMFAERKDWGQAEPYQAAIHRPSQQPCPPTAASDPAHRGQDTNLTPCCTHQEIGWSPRVPPCTSLFLVQ